jgi:hypothetical protein
LQSGANKIFGGAVAPRRLSSEYCAGSLPIGARRNDAPQNALNFMDKREQSGDRKSNRPLHGRLAEFEIASLWPLVLIAGVIFLIAILAYS